MQTKAENISTNVEHWDLVWSKANIHDIVTKVSNLNEFLDDATKTDTSWHGLYQGGFAERIVGKRVFEIGCGNGLNALIMATLGAQVVANDISFESERIIREASSILNINNIQPLSGNFADLPLERHTFDFIVGKAFLHHLTHELEEDYLLKMIHILKPSGEARFFEPAENSHLLNKLRWIVPVRGRPSILCRKKYTEWITQRPQPDRDNSSTHYFQIGKQYFHQITIVPIGSIERIHRLIPGGNFNRRYRCWAHRTEEKLPMAFRCKAARSQLIIYRCPRL